MKNNYLLVIGVLALAGCQNLHDKSEVQVGKKTLDAIDPPTSSQATVCLSPPDTASASRMYFLPGTDKLYVVGDRIVARRETDPQPLLMSESARRLIAGNPDEGDLSLQPALLQKELAEELARSRQINSENRVAMIQMMSVTKQLVSATSELTKRNKELAKKLDQQIAYSATLEPKSDSSDKGKH